MSRKTNYLLVVIFMLITVSVFADSQGNCLEFDGVDDYVDLGEPANLKLGTFTLSGWFQRTGTGITASTGAGGILAEPLITKGRGESDGNNRDMNYFLGISQADLVIVADFEDMATGGNHPVAGITAIEDNVWYFITATYDGSIWKLYLNGNLEVESTVNETPRYDSIQDNAIGTTLNSTGTPSGYFNGLIDEVSIWDIALNANQIQDMMLLSLSGTESGLISYWQFNETTGTLASDTASSNDGTLTNMTNDDWINSTAPYIADESTYTLDFDGSDDYVDLGNSNSLKPADDLTIEMWVDCDNWSTSPNTRYICNTETGGYVIGSNSSSEISASIRYNDSYHSLTFSTVGLAGGWHHISMTFDGRYYKLFVDGDLKDESDAGAIYQIQYNASNHTLLGAEAGSGSSATGYYFDGKIDEVRIWDIARTENEINQTMYEFLDGTESGLISCYQLNTGESFTTYDLVSANNGTMNNMTETDWVISDIPEFAGVSGIISSDTVWNDDYVYVTGDITVNNNVTLTIAPGTVVSFEGDYRITVNGRILAIGTETDGITFTTSDQGGTWPNPVDVWEGIIFDNTLATNDSTKFVYCLFERGEKWSESTNSRGGAIWADNFDKILIDHCEFINNKAFFGAAVSFENCSPIIMNSTFYENYGVYGGAIDLYHSSATILNCTFDDNVANYDNTSYDGMGGAIHVKYGSPDLSYSIFLENNVEKGGGAVFTQNTTSMLIRNCSFFNNHSTYGGAFCLQGGLVTITNCTITGNTTSNNDGAAFNLSDSNDLDMYSCIIYGNGSSQAQIDIVTDTCDPNFYNCDIQGGSAGFTGGGSGGNYSGDYLNCIDVNPEFTDENNDDYTLQSKSPCINTGYASATTGDAGVFDLAGNVRFYDFPCSAGDLDDILDRIDIGAYEYSNADGNIPNGIVVSGDHTIAGNLIISNGATVDIAAGAELAFALDKGIYIYGSLNAVGSSSDMIRIFPEVEADGFAGLYFLQATEVQSSLLEYCRIENGKGIAGFDGYRGGNIYADSYDEIEINNSIISGGNAYYGGGLFLKYTDIIIRGSVVCDNEAEKWGAGFYAYQTCDISIINSTIVNNSSTVDLEGGALRFSTVTPTPQITNTIIWNNGENPISSHLSSSLEDISYCNVSYEIASAGNNISAQPSFLSSGNHPYSLNNGSFDLNMGTPDASGLVLSVNDLVGNDRIFNHTSSSYDRIDIGAYEFQGLHSVNNLVASDGDNEYPGFIYISWDYNEEYEPATEAFRIFRNGTSLNLIDNQSSSYSDYGGVPGQVYTYYVQTFADGLTGNSMEDSGFMNPNGLISGTINTTNNNPVHSVKVTLNPSTGSCLGFDSANQSSVAIGNPGVNMDLDFTIELWVKTYQENAILLNKGAHSFFLTGGVLNYSDGSNTLTQPTRTLVNDGDWHHIAVVNNVGNTESILYLDGIVVAEQSSVFSGSSDSGFSSDESFTGFLDDLRIWSVIRDSTEINEWMNMTASPDETSLAGYWPMNEGAGNIIYDAVENSHNGTQTNCEWSNLDPDILLGAFTDAWGEYIIRNIFYGDYLTFEVIPYKSGHVFQPELRNVTLSQSNIAQNGINFIDNSMIPITGQMLYSNTEVPVAGALILINGENSIPPTYTDAEGNYLMEVEHGTQCYVTATYRDHIILNEYELGSVIFPQVNIDFEDIYTTQFRLEVVGGNDSYPIGDFDVTMQSVNGYYLDEITGSSWVTGGILVSGIPPIDYNVTVDPTGSDPFGLAIDEQFQNMKTDLIELTYADSTLDSLRFVWKAPLEISVSWPDTLNLYNFLEYPESEFYVLPQNEWMEVEIQALENYNFGSFTDHISYLKDCDITINDEIGSQGETETSFAGDSLFIYEFAPYLPNLLSGSNRQYQKMLEVTVEDTELNRFATQTDWVLTEGVRPLESTFATTSPEIPFLILHDPPGDGSSATFGQSSSHSIGFSTSLCEDREMEIYSNIHLGPDITLIAGSPFFSVETEIDMTIDLDYGMSMGMSQTTSMEQGFTFTTTQEYSTSDDDQVIGGGSDLFVGGAMNLIWGVTNELSWDVLNQAAIIDTSVMVTPNGFATIYVYTANQIENTVIPNLLMIGDPESADLWQEFLDNNEDNKENAAANPNHPDNMSFNAGASYTYEEETASELSSTVEFEITVSEEFGFAIGATFDGIGGEFGMNFRTAVTMGVSQHEEYETVTTTSFTLADDDETSDLNELADYFSVNVKTDPVYGTPVFELVSGGSSCPWEPNTIPREGVSLTANTYTASGLLEGEEAAFLLQLGNTSQTGEDRRYYLTVLQGTNPGGAIVSINGVIVENEMAFDVLAGQTVQAVMTVEQGPFAFEYEDLTLEFYSAEDRGNDGPDGHFFDVFKEFNIYWEAPYSRISIASPADNWIINQANNDTLIVMLTDYDLSKPDFASIKLQYKHPADDNWLPAFEIFRDSLALSHPNYIEVPWDVSGMPDGLYEIRAATTDSVQTDYYTGSLQGVIDRVSPLLLCPPEPADDILEPGDLISISFAENIDANMLYLADVSLNIYGGQPIDIEVTCFENTVFITPNIANFWFENETLEAEVSGLTDLYGNEMEEPITWEFYVNSNPVEWNVTKLDVIKPLGEPMTLIANLENNGGQHYSYIFTDYPDSLYHSELEYHAPDWLSITPTNGQLIPLDTQEIQFEISDQIGFGHYETIIYAHTPMGNEAIEIEVDVLSNPPDWSVTQFVNFQSSMSIIGELNIEGDLSVDVNDIIGAFMQEESGDWVCRGVANIEAVPYIASHPYQVFLTIYSDLEDPGRTEDEIIFRLWDNSDNKEYYQIDHSVFGGTLNYLANEVLGTPMNPVNLETVGDMVQDIPLVSGWTWFSTNLDLVPNTINDVLSSLDPIENDFVKDQSQYAQYFTDQWVGSLTTMNNTSMYKINMANEQILEIIGELKDPVLTTISYNSGWNWIGYVPHVSMSVNQAMEDRNNVTGDFIKNQSGYAFYVDSDTGWIGSLRFMNPGEGFMLYANASGSFEYPEYGSRAFDNFPIYEPIVLRDPPDWIVDPQDYEYTSSLTIELQNGGIPATNGNYMVGAFVGEECRGSITSIEVFGTWLYFLTVFSNTQNEEISLKVYDAAADEIIDPEDSFIFTNDLILGTPSAPYELEIDGILAIPQNIGIEISGGNIVISWDAVAGADSYKVFASDFPEGTFTDVSNSGTFDGSRWIAPITELRKFYYVKASTEIARGSVPMTNLGTRK